MDECLSAGMRWLHLIPDKDKARVLLQDFVVDVFSRKRRAAPSFLAPPRGAGTGKARPLGVLWTKRRAAPSLHAPPRGGGTCTATTVPQAGA